MKRALAPLALLLALCAPAHAAITQIVGSGGGGGIGSQSGTGVSTIVITTNTAVPAGNFIVVGIALRTSSTPTVTGCVDNATGGSNTYSIIAAGATTNAKSFMAYSNNVNTLPSGGQITCTPSAAINASSIGLAFSGVASSSPLDAASTTATGSSAIFTVGPTGTLAFPGTTELLVGSIGFATSSAIVSESSGFTNAGSITTFEPVHLAWQIVISNTPVTYAPIFTTSTTYSGILSAFIQATGGGGAVYHGLSSAGAGK